MTKIEAAVLLLKKYKRPMSYKELIEKALNEKLITTKGLTPEDTLRVGIYHENKRREKSGRPKRFDTSNKGSVSLID